MTTPDPTAVDQALAAERIGWAVYGKGQYANGQADQQALDGPVITGLNQQIAALDAQIVQLEAELAESQPKMLVGCSIGGWSVKSKAETLTQAHARIKAAFGGALPVIRAWPPAGATSLGQYADPTCKCYIIEVSQGSTRSQVDAQVASAPPGSILVAWHEPENDNTDAATWQAFVAMVGASIVASGRTDISGAVILMGATYHPTRYKSTGGNPWTYWIPATLPPGITMLGGDMYPRGATDATADTAQTVLQPALDAATQYGVPFVIGEFGCGKPEWSDGVRAKYVSDAFAFMRANPNVFKVVSLFECDGGPQGPWCVLPSPATGQPLLPLTVAASVAAIAAS